MKRLALATVIALAATQAAGCIFTSDDSADANVYATWRIRNINNLEQGCPPGFDTAALFNEAVDSNLNPIGNCANSNDNNYNTCFVDLFNCSDKHGFSYALPPTTYKTWVEITDHNNTALYASTLPKYIDITDFDQDYDTEVVSDGGYFYLSWDLVGGSSGAPLSCSGAANISALSTEVGNSSNFNDSVLPCTDGGGYTEPLVAASYSIIVSALNGANQVIGMAPQLTNKLIQAPNQITLLGTVQIPINGL